MKKQKDWIEVLKREGREEEKKKNEEEEGISTPQSSMAAIRLHIAMQISSRAGGQVT